jgi:transcriptional regulator with XRE-family HTH domain
VVERSGRSPRADALLKLAKALGASVEALLGEAAVRAPLVETPGHVGELERALDEVRELPRRRQRRGPEFAVAFVNESERKAR